MENILNQRKLDLEKEYQEWLANKNQAEKLFNQSVEKLHYLTAQITLINDLLKDIPEYTQKSEPVSVD